MNNSHLRFTAGRGLKKHVWLWQRVHVQNVLPTIGPYYAMAADLNECQYVEHFVFG